MSITFDDRLSARLLAMEQACDELPQIAAQVQAETLARLHVQADLNVYSTAPGAYVRTGELKRGLSTRSLVTRDAATVEAVSASPHAAYVEYGRQGMTRAALQALSQADPGEPLSLGRSGRNWAVSGPIVAPAQAFALWRMAQLFAAKLRAAR